MNSTLSEPTVCLQAERNGLITAILTFTAGHSEAGRNCLCFEGCVGVCMQCYDVHLQQTTFTVSLELFNLREKLIDREQLMNNEERKSEKLPKHCNNCKRLSGERQESILL